MDDTFWGTFDRERARPVRRGVRMLVEDIAAAIGGTHGAGRSEAGTAARATERRRTGHSGVRTRSTGTGRAGG